MNRIIILALILTTCFFSCEPKVLDLDISYEGKKLVVYGMLSSNQQELKVYHTNPVLDSSNDFTLSNVTANLMQNGEAIAAFEFDESIGSLDATLDDEQSYSIEINDGSLVSSTSVHIPGLVPIEDFSYEINSDSSIVDIEFHFYDPEEKSNYYIAQLVNDYGDFIEREDPIFTNPRLDEGVNGTLMKITRDLEMETPVWGANDEFLGIKKLEGVTVLLYHLTEDSYLFGKSKEENSGELGNQFSEQNPLWTNIIGGYGYLGAYSVDSVKIVF